MSVDATDPLRPRLDLEQQRKRAKELLKAWRGGSADAARRFARHLPRLRGTREPDVLAARLALSEAQLVVAREAGFASWPKLKHALEARDASTDERVANVLDAAVRGDAPRVRALLAAEPELARRSLHVACALADADAARALLGARPSAPELARAAGGPYGWSPLLYLTCAALGGPHDAAARVAIARELLTRGADAAEFTQDARLVQGLRTTLSGAVVYARSAALLELLLAAGGARTERLWNTAIVGHAAELDDPRCLELLLRLRPPSWELRGALATAVERHDVRAVRLLLEAGADPNASGVWGRVGTSLHHAVLTGASRELLELLLAHGADAAREDRDGRTALAVARRIGHEDAVLLLAPHGGAAPSAGEALVARALRSEARGGSEARPGSGASAGPALDALRAARAASTDAAFARSDHQTLSWALRTGRADAVPRLLAIGLDPNVADDDGALPLGLAAAAGDAAAVAALLDAGARIDARDLEGRTALQRAIGHADGARRERVVYTLLDAGADAASVESVPDGAESDRALADELRRRGAVERELDELFERAAERVVDGDESGLARLLADEPALVRARSPRPHRATLLHYVAANGIEDHRQKTPPNAVRIAELLLAAGAEPDALALTYGGGPAQTTMALLVSSDHPAAAGVQGELVRLLVMHGANPNGLDDDGLPLATAIAFGKPQAVDALGALARVDNALFAAATERIDVLEREIGPDGRLRAGAGHCRVPWLPMSRDPQTAAEQALGVAAKLGRARSVRWLLARGVAPSAAPARGVTALHEASYGGYLDVVRLLVEHGADPGLREELYGATALGWAEEGKQHAVLAYLLEHHEPDVIDCVALNLPALLQRRLARERGLADAPEGRGGLLRWAADLGFTEVVRILLAHGANRALRDGDGRTALDRARAAGHADVVALLEDGG